MTWYRMPKYLMNKQKQKAEAPMENGNQSILYADTY